MSFIEGCISVTGWIYFAAWSLSFYGQLALNFRLKNVSGMNLDFLVLNATGFSFLSIYSTLGYFGDSQSQDITGSVLLNDLLFAYHALLITLLTCCQALYYPVDLSPARQKQVLVLGYWLVAALLILAEYYAGWTEPSSRWDAVAFLGYFKISISLIKYVPQVYWNWVRKSTSGWSIVNIVLDFTGGLFSFLQLILTRIDGDPNPLNLVKVALGLISMGFDVVFILQHYVWYRQNTELQESKLLSQIHQ